MKSTESFKKVIKDYLEKRASEDKHFAEAYAKPGKNIDDCVTYILNTVQASGCNGFTDDEVFGMAVHYYDEDNIKIGAKISCNVVVNHRVELTEEEKLKAREEAFQQAKKEYYDKMTKKAKPELKKEEVKTKIVEQSLF